MYCAIKKGTVSLILCPVLWQIFKDSNYLPHHDVNKLTLLRMHKQKLKHLRICTNVFCSTRMTKKESNNVRIEWQNDSNSIVKAALGSVCTFNRSFSLTHNKKQFRNRSIKEAKNLKMLIRQIYKPPLEADGNIKGRGETKITVSCEGSH